MARNGPVHVTFVSNIPMQCDDTAALFLLACTIERHMQPKGRWSSCLRKSCTHPTWTCWKSDLQLSALNQRVLLYDILTTQNIGPSIYLLRLLERCILRSRTPSQTCQMLKKKKKNPECVRTQVKPICSYPTQSMREWMSVYEVVGTFPHWASWI